ARTREQHSGRRPLCQMEEPREIDVDDRSEVGFGIFGKGLCNEHAGIVDERIDPSVALDDKSHDAIGGLCARDVAVDHKCGGILALVDRTGVGNDVIADITISSEQCRADAARRAGDDGNLPFGFHLRPGPSPWNRMPNWAASAWTFSTAAA